jgi:hypothetical protein
MSALFVQRFTVARRIRLVPICLPCWRLQFSMVINPPQQHKPGGAMHLCGVCARETNHGIYLPVQALPKEMQSQHGTYSRTRLGLVRAHLARCMRFLWWGDWP